MGTERRKKTNGAEMMIRIKLPLKNTQNPESTYIFFFLKSIVVLFFFFFYLSSTQSTAFTGPESFSSLEQFEVIYLNNL